MVKRKKIKKKNHLKSTGQTGRADFNIFLTFYVAQKFS